jgi:hypothetical protein
MNNIDELMTKLGNDKYKNVSSNLEFLTECGVESSDHVDMLKDAIEYIDILEHGREFLEVLYNLQQQDINRLVNEWENLQNKIAWLEKKKDSFDVCSNYEKALFRINTIEHKLKVKYDYDINKRKDIKLNVHGAISGRFQTGKPNCIEIFKSAKTIVDEINPLILEYKALEEKSEKLWAAGNSQYNIAGEHYLDRYEKIRFDMSQIEHLLKVNYNYDILKSEGSVNNDM